MCPALPVRAGLAGIYWPFQGVRISQPGGSARVVEFDVEIALPHHDTSVNVTALYALRFSLAGSTVYLCQTLL